MSNSLEILKRRMLSGHSGAIYDIVLGDDHLCFTTSADKYTVRWNYLTGEQDSLAIQLNNSGFRVAFNSTYNLLAIGTAKGGIHVIDLSSRKEVRFLTQHQTSIFSLTYNPSTNEFYSGDAEGYFCVWSGATFDLELTLPFVCGKIRQLRLNEEGTHVALCGQDGIVRVLETTFFNVVSEFKVHSSGVNCAVFKDEKLYVGGKNAYLSLWNWKDGKRLQEIPAHNYAIYDMILLHNQQIIVTASFDKTIKVWNSKDLSIIKRIEAKNGGHTHTVNRLAKVSENSFLSVGDDRKIIVWEVN